MGFWDSFQGCLGGGSMNEKVQAGVLAKWPMRRGKREKFKVVLRSRWDGDEPGRKMG